METKEIFRKAFSGVRSAYSCPDHETALQDVLERARKMNKKKRNLNGEEVPYSGGSDKRSVLPVIAGTAAVVAVIGAGIFGIGYMNSHGIEWTPLKEGASYNTGGSQPGVYTAVSSVAAETIDISELKGKIFKFSDCTVMIDYANYDGQYIRVDYTKEFTGEVTQNVFFLDPQDISRYKDTKTAFCHTEYGASEQKWTYIAQTAQASNYSCSFNPALYSETGTERVTDLLITATKDHSALVRQPIWDDIDDEVAEGTNIRMYWASSDVLEAQFDHDNTIQLGEIVVYAVAQDGEKYPLIGNCVDSYVSVNTTPEKPIIRFNNYYISEDPDIPPLWQMKGFEVNGKLFEITEAPEIINVIINENGEEEVIGGPQMESVITTKIYETVPTESGDIVNPTTTADITPPDEANETTTAADTAADAQ